MHDLHAREDVARYLPWDVPTPDDSRRRMGRHQDLRLLRDDDGATLPAVTRQEAHLIGNKWFTGGWGDEGQSALLRQEWREQGR